MESLNKRPLIIGLAGTLNAGKDSLAEYLAEKFGFLHVSTGDMVREMKRREFGADSPKALLLRNDPYINRLREERGPGFLIDAINEDWAREKDKYPGGVVASGMRAIGEAETIIRLGGIIVFVDADSRIRYKRAIARDRDANDEMTYDEFMDTERSEIDVDPNDKSVQNLVAMKDMANLVIQNNQDSVESFQKAAVDALKHYLGD